MTRAYPTKTFLVYNELNKKSELSTDSLTSFLDGQKNEFIKISGGLDRAKPNYLINGNSNRSTSLFFTAAKINEIRDKLSQFSKMLSDSIKNDKDRNEIIKIFTLPYLIADEPYWQLLKMLPANGALAQLSCIKNQIQNDETAFLMFHAVNRYATFKTNSHSAQWKTRLA